MKFPLNVDVCTKETLSIGFVALLLLAMAVGVTATSWDGSPDDATPSQAIWIDPKNVTGVDIGDTFVVDVLVNITDPDGAATGMWGWQYQLQWDPTVLDVVEIQTHGDNVPAGDLMPGHVSVLLADNTTTANTHTYVVVPMGGSAFAGVNSLCTYKFKVIGKGSCPLDIIETGKKRVAVTDDQAGYLIQGSPPIGTVVDGYFLAPYPTALFTYSPPYPSANQTVTFNASASFDSDGTIVSYAWDFGDGVSDAGMVVTHNYTAYGKYNVTLTVTDDDGLTDTTWDIVSVGTVAVFTYSPEFPLTGQTVTFNATESHAATPPLVNYTWNFDDGNTPTTTNPIINHTYTAAGIYNVTLTVTDNALLTDTTWHVVKVGRWPVANYTYSPDYPLVNDAVTFNAEKSSDPNGTIVSYAWNFGDGTTGTGKRAEHTYMVRGFYNVTLTVTDNETLTDSTSALITVFVNPVANFSWSPETPEVSETVTFNASASYDLDGEIVVFKWLFETRNQNISIDTSDPIINRTYTAAGIYDVTLTVRDSDATGAKDAHYATTVKSITIAEASSTISISASPTTIEIGENTTISGSITPNPGGDVTVTIHYRLTGGTWGILENVTTNSDGEYSYLWTPEETGTYEVKASWLGEENKFLGDESSSITITVEEEAAPPPPEPTDYLPYVAIVIVIVVVAAIAVYFLKIRKS